MPDIAVSFNSYPENEAGIEKGLKRLLARCPWLRHEQWTIDKLTVRAIGNNYEFPKYGKDGSGRSIILCGHIRHDDIEERAGGQHGFIHCTENALLNSLFNLWLSKGKQSLCGLNGRYSLVMWDEKEQELSVATDPFGNRHIYYLNANGQISFSTNLSILTRSPHFKRKLDPQGVVESLCLGYQLEDRTLFEGIKLMSPSSLLVLKGGTVHISENKRFAGIEPRPDLDWKDAEEELHFRLLDSLKKRLRDNAEYIIPLSGGLDSRCIAGLAHELALRTRFYTYGVKSCKDIQIAPWIASAVGSKTRVLPNKPDYIWRRWDDPFLLNGDLRAPSIGVFIDFLEQIGNDKGVFISGFLGDTITDSNRILKAENSLIDIYTTYESFFLPRDLFKVVKIPSWADLAQEIQVTLTKIREGFNGSGYAKDIMLNLVTRQRRFFSFQLRLAEYYGGLIVPFEDVGIWEFFLRLPLMALDDKELYRRFQRRYFPGLARIPTIKYGPLLPTAKHAFFSSLQRDFRYLNSRYFKNTLKIPSFLSRPRPDHAVNHSESIRYSAAQLAAMISTSRDALSDIFDLNNIQALFDVHMRGDDRGKWKILAILHILSGLQVCTNEE